MIRILSPWFENLKKRQVKSPKIYFRDNGILHTLVGIENKKQLQVNPKLRAFWEGFALEEIIRTLKLSTQKCYFWATQAKAELDHLGIMYPRDKIFPIDENITAYGLETIATEQFSDKIQNL